MDRAFLHSDASFDYVGAREIKLTLRMLIKVNFPSLPISPLVYISMISWTQMTRTENDLSSRVTLPQTKPGLTSKLLRVAFPVAFIISGVIAYSFLSIEPAKEKKPPEEKKEIRTKVVKLLAQDYQVIVQTNGIVQPHNEVTLSAQVSGQVTHISPAFEAGSYFSAGDVLVRVDSRDYKTALAVAEAQLLGAQAALQLANETYERNTALYARNGVSEAVLKQSYAAKAQAEAQVDMAKAQQEQAARDLERTVIVAPFDGRVRQKNIGLSESVGMGAPLGIIFAVDFAEVRLPISGKKLQFLDLPEFSTDAHVEVQLRNAINKESETIWTAKIVRTEGALDENTLDLFAIARIDDPFGRQSGTPPLRIGQPVVASIAGKMLNGVYSVPRIAVRQLDQVYFVDKVNNTDYTLSSKTLVPVWSDDEHLIVDDASIPDGQLLATTQIVFAPDGAKVEIIPDIPLTATADANSNDTPLAN